VHLLLLALLAIACAALAYWVCLLLGLPVIVAVIAAVLVLLAVFGIPSTRGRRAP